MRAVSLVRRRPLLMALVEEAAADESQQQEEERLVDDPRVNSRICKYKLALNPDEVSSDWSALLSLLCGIVGLTLHVSNRHHPHHSMLRSVVLFSISSRTY